MKKLLLTISSFFCLALASYGFSVYSENFDSYANDATAQGAGYTFGKSVYSALNTGNTVAAPIGGYYPNDPNIHPTDRVVDGALKTWTDFGHAPDFDNGQAQRTLYYTDITLTQDMINAGSFNYSFDYQIGDVHDGTSAVNGAFMKVLDVDAGYSEIAYNQVTYDVNAVGWTSASSSISLSGSGAVAGDIMQFGIFNESVNYTGNGVFTDNISVSAVPEPSTYALIAGFAAFLFVAIRRRK